jgi:mannose-6-phosphate isomerase-like protein (cupin superfamily)
MIDTTAAEHYLWGQDCDGWRLVNTPELSVIQERMPAGTRESRHIHRRARQFFYILAGEAVMELDGQRQTVRAGQGIEIPPGQPHQINNASGVDLSFLVISQPTTTGDRVETGPSVGAAQ